MITVLTWLSFFGLVLGGGVGTFILGFWPMGFASAVIVSLLLIVGFYVAINRAVDEEGQMISILALVYITGLWAGVIVGGILSIFF